MRKYKAITLTHKNISLNQLASYLVADTNKNETLNELKLHFELDELYYLNTCNRVIYFFVNDQKLNEKFIEKFFKFVNPFITPTQLQNGINSCELYEGKEAIQHFFTIPASMDSLVLGENEIIRQFREAYEFCKSENLVGDKIRLAFQQAVIAAKEIYSKTGIAEKPISVASLAATELINNVKYRAAKILFIGAGQTNTLIAKFLLKNGFSNFFVLNRGKENAEVLANKLNCGYALLSDEEVISNLEPEVIITCTAADKPILNSESYSKLNRKNKTLTVLDVAIPCNVSKAVADINEVTYIEIEQLRNLARKNMQFRQKEFVKAQAILNNKIEEFADTYKARKVEVALKHLPNEIRAVKDRAIYEVFSKEIEAMDEASKETLEKVINYMEKKYIGIPIKKAKQVMRQL